MYTYMLCITTLYIYRVHLVTLNFDFKILAMVDIQMADTTLYMYFIQKI